MKVTPTRLQDCFIIEHKVFYDERGFFMESFNERTFREVTGLAVHFVQDIQSLSTKGVLQGLDYQVGEFDQGLLVQVLQGEVLDVAVDIRLESETYGLHEAILLSAENKIQLYVPRDSAHGFLMLSETAL